MERNNERLQHGIHNEDVCNYLELRPEFADWIITTAFYAALQFVAYKIFPFQVPAIEGKKTSIENIDDYYNYSQKSARKISKHELLADLVEKECYDISADYDWLLDMSMKARYSYYSHDTQIANKAIRLMREIKKFCTKQTK